MTVDNRESPGPRLRAGCRAPAYGANLIPGGYQGYLTAHDRHGASVAYTLTRWRLDLGIKVLGAGAGATYGVVGGADLGSGCRGTEVC